MNSDEFIIVSLVARLAIKTARIRFPAAAVSLAFLTFAREQNFCMIDCVSEPKVEPVQIHVHCIANEIWGINRSKPYKDTAYR